MNGISKILVANRGVCACRIIKTCTKMRIDYVTIFMLDDQHSLHTKNSKESYLVKSYMDMDEIIQIAKASSSDAIHPGYGFQAENPSFAEKCAEADITFIGPTAENMLLLGKKHAAREIATRPTVDLPTASASGLIPDVEHALYWGEVIGYPVFLKPSGGGGGIGMQPCKNQEEVRKKFPKCRAQCIQLFGCADIFMEKLITKARHIEVQVFGDGKGNVIHLGERECSVQRRYQKMIEEAPSPGSIPVSRNCRVSV